MKVASHIREPKSRSAGQSIGEWVGIVIAALLAAVVLRAYVVQSFYIPSGSMIPTLEISDRVIVNKLSNNFGELERGDVIVFERPPGETDTMIKDLIKRVVALPGDTIEARDNVLYVNGEPVDEPYLKSNTVTTNLPFQTIGEGEVFVMGDNRSDSRDSRSFGPISKDLIVGKAELRIWPVSRAGAL